MLRCLALCGDPLACAVLGAVPGARGLSALPPVTQAGLKAKVPKVPLVGMGHAWPCSTQPAQPGPDPGHVCAQTTGGDLPAELRPAGFEGRAAHNLAGLRLFNSA